MCSTLQRQFKIAGSVYPELTAAERLVPAQPPLRVFEGSRLGARTGAWLRAEVLA